MLFFGEFGQKCCAGTEFTKFFLILKLKDRSVIEQIVLFGFGGEGFMRTACAVKAASRRSIESWISSWNW